MPEQNTLPGPVFEAGPGWGGKLGRWIKAKWSTRILPAIAVMILLTGIARVYSRPANENLITEGGLPFPSPEAVSIQVQKGEGVIAVSRRALAAYLQNFPDIQLKPEERLHVDNFFKTKFQNAAISAGQEISFLKKDIQQAINEALQLSEGQRQKLRAYLR